MVEINFTLIIQILNFIVLVAVLGKFGFGPLMKVLDERKEKIRADLDGAEQSRIQAEALKSEYESQLNDARAQAQEIVQKAVQEAEMQARTQLDAVHEKIEQEKALAKRQLAEEREVLVRELREEVVDIALAASSQVIAKNLDADNNRKLVVDCIERLDAQQVGR